jgi:hypothetical protein
MRISNFKFQMSKILLCLVISLFTIHSSLFTVYAHVLQTDGSIGAVLHMDPEDDPIAGEQTGFFFEFKDTSGKFNPQNCSCTFSVIEDGKQLFTQPLFQNASSSSLTSASLFYTFPEKNVYQVKVAGQSQTPGQFQSFTLTYDVRVARQTINSNPTVSSNTSNSTSGWLQISPVQLIGGLLTFGFLIFILIYQSKKNQPKSQKDVF